MSGGGASGTRRGGSRRRKLPEGEDDYDPCKQELVKMNKNEENERRKKKPNNTNTKSTFSEPVCKIVKCKILLSSSDGL